MYNITAAGFWKKMFKNSVKSWLSDFDKDRKVKKKKAKCIKFETFEIFS